MTEDVLKLALEALEFFEDTAICQADIDVATEAIAAIKEALKEHAMREVQRLGQEIEQEPVGYWKEHAQGLQRDYDSLLADFQAQQEESNFCQRCGKRTKDIHTCTPPQD